VPSHLVHAYVDRLCFGKVYWQVHRLMDSAYPISRGRHRVFWHDPQSAIAIAMDRYSGDENAILSALLHIQIDTACSANPYLKIYLEMLASENEAQKKRKFRKTKRQPSWPPEMKKYIEDLKKMVEIRRMMGL
jgi:hypothetical protein